MNNIATFFRESKVARFFIPVGITLIVFGVIMFFINKDNQNYIQIEATVSDIVKIDEAYTDTDGNYVEASYEVTLKYEVDSKEYESKLSGVGEYKVGDKMKIYYNPDDPTQITQTISLVLPIAFMAGGIVALVVGIISAINAIKKHKSLKEQEKGWNHE